MATFCASGSPAAPANIQTFTADTSTLPPMIATRPSVCIVVCIRRRSSAATGSPVSLTRGTASTVIASATTSCST